MVPLPRLCWLVPDESVPPETVARWRHRLAGGVLVGNRWTIEMVTAAVLVEVDAFEAMAFLQHPDEGPSDPVSAVARTFLAQGKPVVELASEGLSVRLHAQWDEAMVD